MNFKFKIRNEGFLKQDFAEFCYFDVISYLEMFFPLF